MNFVNKLILYVKNMEKTNMGEWIDNGDAFWIYDLNKFANCLRPYLLNSFKKQLCNYNITRNYLSGKNGLIISHVNFKSSNYLEATTASFQRQPRPRESRKKRKRSKLNSLVKSVYEDFIHDNIRLNPNYIIPINDIPDNSDDDYTCESLCGSLCESRCGSPFTENAKIFDNVITDNVIIDYY
jgi:hypothetical protein